VSNPTPNTTTVNPGPNQIVHSNPAAVPANPLAGISVTAVTKPAGQQNGNVQGTVGGSIVSNPAEGRT
jgi:hypothetical protein